MYEEKRINGFFVHYHNATYSLPNHKFLVKKQKGFNVLCLLDLSKNKNLARRKHFDNTHRVTAEQVKEVEKR